VVSQGLQGRQGSGGPPPDGFRGRPGPRNGLGPIARELNLTDEQKAQIKKIEDSFAANNKELHEQMRSLHESEIDPLTTTTFDEASVRAAAEARAKIDVELQVSRARMMSQIAAVLTADQRAQLAARHALLGPPPPPDK
jgi:Spy/CpxP family protein refolding chaperone